MSDYEIYALRRTFEEHGAKHHGWTNFHRTENGYVARDIQLAWYWLRLGFAAGALAEAAV